MLRDLDQFEFCHLRLELELLSEVTLPEFALLRLRRDLRRSALRLLGQRQAFVSLFDPPLGDDPESVRRYQRPGPAFVLRPALLAPTTLMVGDHLDLELVLVGRGIEYCNEFLACVEELGRNGLWAKEGQFSLAAVAVLEPPGEGQKRFYPDAPYFSSLPRISGRWFLDGMPFSSRWNLTFATPARLMVGNRPLFRGSLQRLIPFVLRRVTSMAHAHCGIEMIADPQSLLARSADLAVCKGSLRWKDWQAVETGGESHDLGGLVGGVSFTSPGDEDLLNLLQLGSLLGIGRGAAYGAGRYWLEPEEGA